MLSPMPRIARIVLPEIPHHVTQRGNNREAVFFDDDDRRMYLELLRDHADRFGAKLWAYCLMPNHVHLVIEPRAEDSLAKAVGRTNFRYAQRLNLTHGRSGHLWQNRFFSCALDDMHLWRAIRYVERNPVRARMVRLPWRYAWSSAAAHVGEADGGGLLDLAAWRREWTPSRWRTQLEHLDNDQMKAIRDHTHTGRPLGDDRFLDALERRLDRRMRPLPIGRPPTRETQSKGRINR